MDYTIDNQREPAHQWMCVTSVYVDRHGDFLELYVRAYPGNPTLWQANDDGYCHFELRTSELQKAIKNFSAIFGWGLSDQEMVEYNALSLDVAIRRVFNVMIAVDQYIVHALGEYSQYQYTDGL